MNDIFHTDVLQDEHDKLVSFLYLMIGEFVTITSVEMVMKRVECGVNGIAFDNKNLHEYAKIIAGRLNGSERNKRDENRIN